MNRRMFFGLLAAVALLPKRAVGKACRAGFMIPRGRCLGKFHHNWRAVTAYTFRIINEDIYGKTRLVEQVWEDDVFVASLPVAFRRASNRVKTTITLPKGRYRHTCRWIESIA